MLAHGSSTCIGSTVSAGLFLAWYHLLWESPCQAGSPRCCRCSCSGRCFFSRCFRCLFSRLGLVCSTTEPPAGLSQESGTEADADGSCGVLAGVGLTGTSWPACSLEVAMASVLGNNQWPHPITLSSSHFTKGAVSQSSATNVETKGTNKRQPKHKATAYFHHTDGNEIPPFTSPWMWKDSKITMLWSSGSFLTKYIDGWEHVFVEAWAKEFGSGKLPSKIDSKRTFFWCFGQIRGDETFLDWNSWSCQSIWWDPCTWFLYDNSTGVAAWYWRVSPKRTRQLGCRTGAKQVLSFTEIPSTRFACYYGFCRLHSYSRMIDFVEVKFILLLMVTNLALGISAIFFFSIHSSNNYNFPVRWVWLKLLNGNWWWLRVFVCPMHCWLKALGEGKGVGDSWNWVVWHCPFLWSCSKWIDVVPWLSSL